MSSEKIKSLFLDAFSRRVIKKAVFSKSEDKNTLRESVTVKAKDNGIVITLERLTRDNKAYHRIVRAQGEDVLGAFENAADELSRMAMEDYRQVNLITTAGDVEIKRSKSGSVHIGGKLAENAEQAVPDTDGKRYILDASRDIGFLRDLGISDANGRIHDKKQAKFRQINRFLEIVRDVEDKLPSDRPAVIYDLCCGKSYLTFAVYYYFAVLKKREVRMYGVDLKQDVIEYCNAVAKRQHFDTLSFVSGNINEYKPPEAPDMVISLHACDIATDIVLANAIKWGAGIILSTPCCHHELSGQLSAPAKDVPLRDDLSFILDHPMLKQKLCDAVTDALRVKRLESMGYSVTTLELIDPEETPKNLMIRATYNKQKPESAKKKALDEYRHLTESLGVTPYLDGLICENGK